MDYRLALLLEVKDKMTAQVKTSLQHLKTLKREGQNVKVNLSARDKITPGINKINSRVKALQSHPIYVTLMAKAQQALRALENVRGKLRALSSKVTSVFVSVKDKASSVLSGIKGKLTSLRAGVTFTVVAKMAINAVGQEQTQKITINRVLENSGKSKRMAKAETERYYKYLEDYANKTPFTTQSMAMMGTKSMMISKGDVEQAKAITDAMANTKAFVGNLRTEEEVAEAFFSASQGNLEMLNNMLGTNYQTFQEAMQGVATNQSGLVNEMAKTLPGAISTLVGVFQVQLKNLMKPFSEGLAGTIGKVTQALSVAMPRIGGVLQQIFTALSPVGAMFNGFLDSIINKSPSTMRIFSLLGTIIVTSFQMIGAVVQAVGPIVIKILQFIGQNAGVISSIIKALGTLWQLAWTVMGTALKLAWAIIKPPLDTLGQMLVTAKGAVDALRDAWSKAMNFIKNNPITAKINKVFNGGKEGHRHASGLTRVPYDNYPARLHQGERVLNRVEADNYKRNKNKGFTINKLADTIVVREEADIDKIMNALNRKVRLAVRGGV